MSEWQKSKNLYLVLQYSLPVSGERTYVVRAADYINTVRRMAEDPENTDAFIGMWIRAHPVLSMHEDHETAKAMVKLTEEDY